MFVVTLKRIFAKRVDNLQWKERKKTLRNNYMLVLLNDIETQTIEHFI